MFEEIYCPIVSHKIHFVTVSFRQVVNFRFSVEADLVCVLKLSVSLSSDKIRCLLQAVPGVILF